jgi:hypothetical protein
MPGEYAATNANEHLAEMASSAWGIVAPPKLFCPVETPVERLHDAEMRVPGTDRRRFPSGELRPWSYRSVRESGSWMSPR